MPEIKTVVCFICKETVNKRQTLITIKGRACKKHGTIVQLGNLLYQNEQLCENARKTEQQAIKENWSTFKVNQFIEQFSNRSKQLLSQIKALNMEEREDG